MRIFLTGFMGSGKSTVGKTLAQRLNLQFIDLDQVITEKAGMRIPEIFEKEGQTGFRRMEREALLETVGADNIVVATGGGTPCFFNNMEEMKKAGLTVFIELDAVTLRNRLEQGKEIRPLLAGKNGEELEWTIQNFLDEREKWYRAAHISVDGLSLKGDRITELAEEAKTAWTSLFVQEEED